MLVVSLTLGAAPLALWAFIRLDRLAPKGFGASAVHIGLSLVLLNVAGPILMRPIHGDGESVTRTLVALFAVFLPALVYVFLSGLWALSGLARRLRPG
jgi:hypothetical protein